MKEKKDLSERTKAPKFCREKRVNATNAARIACDLCGSEKTKPYLRAETFRYERCVECGVVYQNPQPAGHDIDAIYADDYFDYEIENQRAFFTLMKLGLEDIRFDERTAQYAEKTALDIGCATGLLLNYLKGKGWETTGIEICEASAAYARNTFGLNVIGKKLEEAAFETNTFAVVHMSHVIEHVQKPQQTLNEIYRVMQPGGYLVITTPNVGSIPAKLYGKRWRSAMEQHLYLFSKKTMRNALIRAGFTIAQQTSWGSVLPLEVRPPRRIKGIVDKATKRLNLGDVMLFAARK